MNFEKYNKLISKITAPEELKKKTLILMNKEKKHHVKPVFMKLKYASIITCILVLSITTAVFAASIFSPLDGDELRLSSEYKGNGIITVNIDNLSEKTLALEKNLKLMLYSTGKEVERDYDGKILVTNTKVDPKSSTKMKIDISNVYNIEKLEQPLTDDAYYLILTNNRFIFGHDWQCTVKFSKTIVSDKNHPGPMVVDSDIIKNINKELQYYFESNEVETPELEITKEYVNTYEKIFENIEKPIVLSSSGKLYLQEEDNVIFDKNLSQDEQKELIGMNYFCRDAGRKLIATMEESALVVSAMVPQKKYPGSYSALPMLYIMTYDKEDISSNDDYVFIYGNLYTFNELEDLKVYEDKLSICYNISSLIYTDLDEYIESYVQATPTASYNDEIDETVKSIYNYFNDNMSNLFKYHESK